MRRVGRPRTRPITDLGENLTLERDNDQDENEVESHPHPHIPQPHVPEHREEPMDRIA